MTATRSLLEIWWDRDVARRAQALVAQRPLPHDGASWACYVNFFGVVGLADARIRVEYVNPIPVMVKCVEIWQQAKQREKNLRELTRLTEELGGYDETPTQP